VSDPAAGAGGDGRLGYRHRRVQRIRRLAARPALRHQEEAFVVEGPKLVGEALAAGAAVEGVYAGPGYDHEVLTRAADAGVRIFRLAPGVLERVATTTSPQPVVAVVAMPTVDLGALEGSSLLVVCADLRDPGNLGTVLRSAEAAGADGVVTCAGTVDAFNPKCVRASAGSLFHVPLAPGPEAPAVLERLGAWGLQRAATVAHGGVPHDEADLTRPTALVLGNEARGLPPGVEGAIDLRLTVPIRGRAESLNVGMAAAVLCFEAARQRGRRR